MSDSQSRYSIVERLTEKKLSLIREKAEISSMIKRKEDEIIQVQEKLKEHEADVKFRTSNLQQELSNERRDLRHQARMASTSLESVKAHRKEKERAIDDQIAAVELALTKVEEVSKAAGQQQQ